MNFSRPDAELFVPDHLPVEPALARVTQLAIGAHPDDLEFMAFQGIAACYGSEREWFGGVICTDGAGSARTGPYARHDDQAMREVRRREQNLAASIGRYGVMIQLGHPSAMAKGPRRDALRDDLTTVLQATRPRVVYTHNLADKHDTHVGVGVTALEAIRRLPPGERPQAVYGCEVWRGLDWMLDADKTVHDVSRADELAAALSEVFDSQIAGGKRYDRAVAGRRLANATFFDPHAVDEVSGAALSMDLTPLARDETLDIAAYVDDYVERFRTDVRDRLRSFLA